MRKLWALLLTVVMAAGLACVTARAAEEAAQPTPPAAPPQATARPPAPARSSPAGQVEMVKQMISRWEEMLSRTHGEEAKTLLNEAISKAKELEATLEKRTAAFQAGQDDVVRNTAGVVQTEYAALGKYFAIIPILLEIDRTKAMQDEQGKDNPDLSAHCQKIIDLLNKKLELQTQLVSLENDLNKERGSLRQPMRGMAPAAPPPGRAPTPPPASAPTPPPAEAPATK